MSETALKNLILAAGLLLAGCALHREPPSAGSPPFDHNPICECTVPWASTPCWQVDRRGATPGTGWTTRAPASPGRRCEVSERDGLCDFHRFSPPRCIRPGTYGSPDFVGVAGLPGSTRFVRDSRWCEEHRHPQDTYLGSEPPTTLAEKE